MTLLQAATLWELIDTRAAATPRNIFLVDDFERTMTFAEYRDAVLNTAAGLKDLGVEAGDTVAWQLPTWLESMVLMGAVARLGARQLPLLPIYREAELSRLLDRSGAQVWALPSLWKGTDYHALSERVRRTNPGIRTVFCDNDLPVGDPAILPPPQVSGSHVTWLFPTSGTTSAPKIVMHTDHSIMAGGAAFCHAQGLRPDDRYGIAFPVTHIGGANNLAGALRCGYSLALSQSFDPTETTASFRRHNVTIAGGGPAFYAAFLAEQRRNPSEPILPHLRFMTGGGAPMPPAMHRQVRDEIGGAGCAHGYGMTESCIVAMNHPDDTDEHLANTVGRPVPYVELDVLGADGPVAAGESGEIRIRGEAVFQGYLGEPTSGLDADGWYRTGDIGQLDEDGYLHITGRLKDIVIRKGENISATELEDVLYAHPGIDEVAVIGLPDDERGERVCAVVCVTPGQQVTLSDIADHCTTAGLMRQKIPEQLEVVDALPRNPAGKVLKKDLRNRFAASVAR
ncbi:class I adenylate-forming enzyme family protein [Rhodococcus sp. B50]|uniref:class I adenylate-forming enzyme family protein n=1 Tax=Rhodococcus sp. B50 TaxID=2682847 RepID=UPI001BD392A5|nr:class I adenylate-forming enzyme family protein [Rhodococcus sp. B50]MBS9376293.1 Medium-chain fatty-acid--CoA ligase [Rhodococcus sp. B50]